MWTFTQNGFYSVVEYVPGRDGNGVPQPPDAGKDDLLLVRTRAEGDMARLLQALELPGSRAISTPSADYPWRAVLTRTQWSEFLTMETEQLDYPNFKSRVQLRSGTARHDVYVRVWADVHALSGIGNGGSATAER